MTERQQDQHFIEALRAEYLRRTAGMGDGFTLGIKGVF